jgi:hypothetical protein
LAISIQKNPHGKQVITLDPNRIQSYLRLSDEATARLTRSFSIPRDLEPKRVKEHVDYEKLSEQYRELIQQGYFKNQAELSRYLGVSRAWVTKVLKKGVTGKM